MSTVDWEDLRARLVGTPDSTLHARVQWDDGEAASIPFMGPYYRWGPGPRCMGTDEAGGAQPASLELWRHGRKIRVERNGRPYYISDGSQAWFFREDHARPLVVAGATASYGGALVYSGEAQWLVLPPPAAHWTDDNIQPDGPVEEDSVEGRSSWSFVISGIRVWIDQASLHVLALQLDGSTYREKLVAPEIGQPLDDDLFTWTGPVVTARERKKLEKTRGNRQWFVDNVVESESELESLPVTLDLTPTAVPRRNDVTGEFEARGPNMALSRHLPDTDFRCEEHVDAHRWTAQGYHWQLHLCDDLTLGREGIQDVWNQLHPGEEVTGYRPPGQ
ncbi:hypothetical protein BJF89_01400 [Corynebacterium sp. CNJ-954]|uniref:hypothetical protein n=1 Tax=Corynebacterium sp. CNJ-954 TaxID=1904962 RepID=UPI0009608739|nr:hypothetical protein [Corynebacterium sp. CNJ-954]OLT54913.1 hypothetical protein BJF89_01400 [Corynebacterium sp. CNJ-954]